MAWSIESFIVRALIDEKHAGPEVTSWHITHVSSRQNKELADLDQIAKFIVRSLNDMGIRYDEVLELPLKQNHDSTASTNE